MAHSGEIAILGGQNREALLLYDNAQKLWSWTKTLNGWFIRIVYVKITVDKALPHNKAHNFWISVTLW